VHREVYAYSPFYRARLDDAGLGPTGVRGQGDLFRLPTTTLAEVADPAALVLRPERASIARHGERRLAWRMRLARLGGRSARVGREHVDPVYKPVHWVLAGDLPVGYSSADLSTLAELGRRWLEGAGLLTSDVLVSVLPPGPHVAFWQLVLGARRGGIPSIFLAPGPEPAQVERLRPDVLAGPPAGLARLLQSLLDADHRLPGLHTVLTAGEVLDSGTGARLAGLAAQVAGPPPGGGKPPAVLSAWAPPGARAVWAQCRGGEGLHTWPTSEVLEVVDPLTGMVVGPGADGEVVWTALGWHGSVLLRLRTGAYGILDGARCDACGGSSPRLKLSSALPPFSVVLDGDPGVAAWQAELRTVDGHEELVVFVAPSAPGDPGPVLRALDRQLSVTQFVVLDRDDLEDRLAAAGDSRVLDHRH